MKCFALKCQTDLIRFTSSLFSSAPPKIIDITIESNQNDLLRENEEIILKCTARGIPQPNIIWSIPGRKSQLNNKRNDRSISFVFERPIRRDLFLFSLSLSRLDIIVYENKILIKNLSRTTPMDYRCIADNGIPPRDTRTKRLIPSSNCLKDRTRRRKFLHINENSRGQLSKEKQRPY